MARFHGLADHDRMVDIANALLEAGTLVDGDPGAGETPLITAVSYSELGVVQALVEAGANLEARGFAAPGETALAHAAYFGNPEAAELLVAAGARVSSLAEAAATGDLRGSRGNAVHE
jgi:ankyrin repeat protein